MHSCTFIILLWKRGKILSLSSNSIVFAIRPLKLPYRYQVKTIGFVNKLIALQRTSGIINFWVYFFKKQNLHVNKNSIETYEVMKPNKQKRIKDSGGNYDFDEIFNKVSKSLRKLIETNTMQNFKILCWV